MPIRIQRVPAGFTELLRIMGQDSPRDMHETLVGNVEMLQFYLSRLGLSSASAANAAVSAPGNSVSITVPSGEVWWLAAAQLVVQATTVGDRVRTSIGIAADSFQTRVQQGADQTALSTTARLVTAIQIGAPLVLVAGQALEGYVDDIALAAGSRVMTLSTLFYRLSVNQ